MASGSAALGTAAQAFLRRQQASPAAGPGHAAGRGSAATAPLGEAARAFLRAQPARPMSPRTPPRDAAFEQREIATLLLMPFFLLAFALAMSQSWRHPQRTAELQRPTPEVAAPARPAVIELAPPQLRLPPGAPAIEATPERAPPAVPPVQLAAPAFSLPPGPPSVAAPDIVLPAPRLALPSGPPAVQLPPVELVAPAFRLPPGPPSVTAPDIALPAPRLALPSSPPPVQLPAVELAAPAFRLPPGPPAIQLPVELATPALRLPLGPPPIAAPPPPVVARLAVPVPPRAPLAIDPAAIDRQPPPAGAGVCLASPGFGLAGPEPRPVSPGEAFGERLAAAARAQIGDLVIYNDKYRRIAFPMGDVPAIFGVCTDVVIRAYRALGVDLQELVQRARVGSGDTSIQHRRTETLRRFLAAKGQSLPVSAFPEDYQPGDVVTYHRPQNRHSRSHIAIVSDVMAPSGRPMIVHNRGWGPQLEDALFVDRITGHYRFHPAASTPSAVASAAVPAAAAAAAAATVTRRSARPVAASRKGQPPQSRAVHKAAFAQPGATP